MTYTRKDHTVDPQIGLGIRNQYVVVIGYVRRQNHVYVRLKCDCGKVVIRQSSQYRRKSPKSCGCKLYDISREAQLAHGLAKTKEYKTWTSMMHRCYNRENKSFPRYGERGIIVCDRWHDPVAFFEDMGERPPGATLDRINNDGNYEPSNCRWATMKTQANNKANNRLIEFNGETLTLSQWSDKTGINQDALWNRLRLGWPVERALTARLRVRRRPASARAIGKPLLIELNKKAKVAK